MAELSLPLLGLLTGLALVGALPPLRALSRAGRPTGTEDAADGAAWITLLLALVLVLAGADVIAVTVLGSETAFVLLTAAAGVLTAAGASRRLRRRQRAVPALVLGGLLVLLLLIYQLGRPGNSTDPLSLFLQELQGLDPTQLQALLLIGVCWLMGAWVGWFAIAERSGLVAAGLPLVVLVSDLINSPPATQALPVAQVVVAAVATVALIGWTHQERQLPLWRQMGGGAQQLGLGRHLRLICLLAVGVGVLALALPPLNRDNISSRFFGGAQGGGPPIDYAQTTSGYDTAVVPGGAVEDVGTEVLTYTTNAPSGRTYLAGEVFSDFSAGDWFPRYDTDVLLNAGQALPAVGALTQLRDQRRVRVTVHYVDPSTSAAPDLLYGGSPIDLPRTGHEYEVSGEGQGNHLLDVEQVAPAGGAVIGRGRTVTTYATVSTATPAQLERAGTHYPSWVRQFASLAGAGQASQLAAIASAAKRMAGDATDPYQAAHNIELALRHDETYSLDPPPVPPGVWPVVYFLDSSHLGYCQYFASAMGAMLRSLGIPSRLVGGFDAGLDGTVSRSDAHVWVQAYFPSYGWVNFEPTPAAFQRTTPATQPVISATVTPGNPNGLPGLPHPGVRQSLPSRPPRPEPKPTSAAPVLLGVLIGLGALVLLLLGTLLWWSWRVRSPAQLRSRLSLLARLGWQRRPQAQTIHELARTCSALSPNLEPALLQLADQAERISFAGLGIAGGSHLSGWPQIGRRYPLLLWRAWRSGQRSREVETTVAPTLVTIRA